MFIIASGQSIKDIFSHRGDSNEYTQHTIFNIKVNDPKLSQICSYGRSILFQGTQERVLNNLVLNKLSLFEPLKSYCNSIVMNSREN